MDALLRLLLFIVLSGMLSRCTGQTDRDAPPKDGSPPVGGGFENSSFTYMNIPSEIHSTDTSPGWDQDGVKLLLTGIVLAPDGKTPVPDVLIYYYHTNVDGKYVHDPREERSMPPNELGQTHGHIRGWVRTDISGRYSIYTVRPGVYPTNDEPAHVHVTIKENNDINEYYIDDLIFDDDKLLTSERRKRMSDRGGSGVLRLVRNGDLFVGERNIILGLNIPDHPAGKEDQVSSGRKVGEEVVSFIPFHAWGVDKGTRACPICKYGWYHGVLYFVGNDPDWDEIRDWLVFLEAESERRDGYLKAYFIYGNEQGYDKRLRETELSELGEKLGLKNIALTFVPSFSDSESEIHLNRIDADAGNTIILYRRSVIIDKYIDLRPTKDNFTMISQRLDATINEYFNLPAPKH